MKENYYNSFVSLRGIFIMGIVLFHMDDVFHNIPAFFYPIVSIGGVLGNSFFFMLSGFLITHTYKNIILSNSIRFLYFIRKRLKKLYPLYFFTNILSMSIIILFWGIRFLEKKRVLLTFLLLTSSPFNAPTWFVSMLLLYYVIFYFVIKLTSTKSTYFYLLTLILIISSAFFILSTQEITPTFHRCILGMLNFFVGIILYELLSYISSKNLSYQPWIPASILVCYLLFEKTLGYTTVFGDDRLDLTFLFCPLIIFLSATCELCKKILTFTPLYKLGEVSIFIFFIHGPLLDFFSNLTNKWIFLSNFSLALYLITLFLIVFILNSKRSKVNC